jgi:hypothetical protein
MTNTVAAVLPSDGNGAYPLPTLVPSPRPFGHQREPASPHTGSENEGSAF